MSGHHRHLRDEHQCITGVDLQQFYQSIFGDFEAKDRGLHQQKLSTGRKDERLVIGIGHNRDNR